MDASSTGDSGSDTVVSVRKFLESWDQDVHELSKRSPELQQKADIAARMGVSEDLVEELSSVCSVDTLLCGDEPADKQNLLIMKGVPQNLDLTCVKYQERELERRKLVEYKLFVMQRMKYKVMDVVQMPPDPSIKIEDDKRVPVPNVVLTVKVFRPKLQTSVVPKGETFQVLGTQKLTDLRDSITCVKDDAVAGDFSDYPLVPKEALTPARNIYKSGLFFIEDTFYNDMREPDNRDYSAPIREWAAKKNEQGADNFRTAKMEDTTFNDLEIQFGAPYLYQHQGNCEHLMVFTDLRLLHPDDPQSITMYPHLVSETVNKRTLCRSCAMDSAKWVVYGSQLTPESPCFLCHNCFMTLHYDENGQRVCSFQAFKYREKVAPP
ncbi:hypothetical protein BaRGS_00021953 [Batillaria attramentaria]|uniref:snRNA-activating protein complex subunit 3 n=1 Tax=Batillaria attramentaria TaxID=370345 RepID=A0ABD0KHY2_9CAEN